MKLRNLFFASLAMVTFAACSNDDEPGIENNEPVDASLVMKVTTTGNKTKADTDPVNGTTTWVNESKINNLKIYVFTGKGEDMAYFSEVSVVANGEVVTPATNTTQEASEPSYSVAINGLKTNTAYTLVAIANPNFDDTNVDLKSNFLGELQKFNEQFSNTGNFTMVGLWETPSSGLNASPSENVASINISRRLAAVEIRKITMDLAATTPINFKEATAHLEGIALVNVRETVKTGSTSQVAATGIDNTIENGTADLIHGKKWSTANAVSNAANANLYQNYTGNTIPNLGLATAKEAKTIENVYNRLYAFPTKITVTEQTTSEDKLRFLLKIRYEHSTLGNQTRYYNIFVNANEILNNTLYKIDATITGIGSTDPDVVDETAADVTATINVLPWNVAVQTVPDLKD